MNGHGRQPIDERVAAFEADCRRRGLALTIQRRAVFETLARHRDHPSADQVYEELQARLPGLSRTTVYRVLDTLVRQGLARKVLHHGAVARFDPATDRHHHLVCDSCGALVDLDDDAVPELRVPEARGSGFQIRDYTINFTGICRDCRQRRSAAKED
jgi:Fur family peroxide stress response transcriptional regulator